MTGRFLAAAALVGLAMAHAPASAAPLTPEQIDRHLKQAHTGCTVTTKVYGTGLVKGLAAPLTLVQLSLEGCGGGNNSGAELVGVYERAGKITVAEAPAYMGSPQAVKIVGDRIVVQALSYTPTDPRCCPSLHRAYQLVFDNGKLIQNR